MTPERIKLINRIFEAAVGRAPAERSAYLDGACAGDPGLRAEVESLIARRSAADGADAGGAAQSSAAAARGEVVPGRTTLGSYRIIEKLGSGGMGTVYLAKDSRLGRRVALKLLPEHFARDEELVRRFEQEARAASALNHPNIITVHEIGEAEGRRFIVTEYVEGRTLRERINDGRFELAEALDICAQVAGALVKAHDAGVLHRDIKPENVMVDEEGHVKVLDFGIAKRLTPASVVDTEAPTNAQVNTAAGIVLGTSTYMSPEQVRGQELDARTDVWSLGVMFYEMLAGRTPFEAQTYGDLIVSILHDDAPPLSDHGVRAPAELERVLSLSLAKDRAARYPSARELRDELRRLRKQLDFSAETVRDAGPAPAGSRLASAGPKATSADTPGVADPHGGSAHARGGAAQTPFGAADQHAPARHAARPAQPHGARPPKARTTTEQRRQLTVLFADFAGLAALTEGADAEDISELMAALWPLVDGVVEGHGGVVDKHVGETLVALWGAREAHEDDPERAVRAALAMQSAVASAVAENAPRVLGIRPRPAPHAPRADGADASGAADKLSSGAAGKVSSGEADKVSSGVGHKVSAGERGGVSAGEEAGTPPLMRVGVSTGLVLLGEVGATGELTLTGDPVRMASALLHAAPVGSVLVSHDTYRHVRGVFNVHAPETLAAGYRTEPVQFYRVRNAKPRAFRVQTRGVEGVETRMVGRKSELRRLTDALESVFDEREAHVVTVIADAGLGKSRLLYEFYYNWLELLPDLWYIFNGRASESAQGLPYALVRDVFSFRFLIQDSDPPEVAREKLERGMIAMCPGTPEEEVRMRAHFIGQLIGFDYSESPHLSGIRDDARQMRDRAFRYAAQFFADISRTYPVALFLDDLHWADDGSLDFVDYLARECARSPLMILCLARPALLERRPAWGEGRERHERLRLQPLSKKESRQLVEEIMRRARGVPAELRELVVSGAEGNPFYVEELIKMFIDEKVIVAGAEVWSVDASRLGDVRVPATLTGVLQARLDRLTAEEKVVLQRASVIGRIFWDGAVEHLGARITGAIRRETSLASISPTDVPVVGGEAVASALESQRRKELIYRRESSSFAGSREYIFKHALLRDVTYESVLKRERREYHRRAAEWLAWQSGGRAGECAGLVAEHYERAQEFEPAAEWYGRAGRQARETYAPETAINYYRKALDFLARSPAPSDESESLARRALRAEWCEGLGEALRVQARYAAAIEAYHALRLAAEDLGHAAMQARAWNEIALAQNSQGDNRAALESARRAEQIARSAGRGVAALTELARALNLQSQASTRLGDVRAALMLADRALTFSNDLGDAGRRVRADSSKSLGMAYHSLGRFEQAEEFKGQALQTYRELGDRRSVGNLLNSLGETARLRGDYSAALARYQEALTIAREIGNHVGVILYLSNLGGARLGLADYEAAESDLRQSIELATEAGYVGLSENYRFLAEALLGRGRLEEARDAALHALDLGSEIENQEHIAEAWRALGLVASHLQSPVKVGGDAHPADACFRRSLEIFKRIQMEAERARTLRDWARHELTRGDAERGQQLWREALEAFRRLRMTPEVERMTAER
jgi:serine/threonine protein kinase/class 3 adenylate cyclase/tetratricopeptide (TPR) repeat protein